MALRLSVIPHQPSCRPGDVLHATVEVAYQAVDATLAVELAGLVVECLGTERVDTNWVSSSYAADSPPVARDRRCVVRQLLRVQAPAVLQDATLLPGFRQQYLFRLQLPDALPPSFKGTAVRYAYELEARALYTTSALMPLPSDAPSPSPSDSDSQYSATPKSHTNGMARRGSRGSSGLLHGVKLTAAGQRPRKAQQQSVRVPIRMWPPRVDPAVRFGGSGAAGAEEPPGIAHGFRSEGFDLTAELKPMPDPSASEAANQLPDAAQSKAKQLALPFQEGVVREGDSDGVGTLGPGGEPGAGAQPPASPSQGIGRRGGASADTPTYAAESSSLKSYNLRLGEEALVRVSMQAPLEGALQPGATLTGTLDFRASQEAAAASEGAQGPRAGAPRCVAVAILLETEEAVQPQWHLGHRAGAGAIRRVYEEHQEFTPNTLLSHFMLSIPLDAPAAFATPLISLRWLLRFEFTANYRSPGGGWAAGRAPEQVNWVLPVLVRAPGAAT